MAAIALLIPASLASASTVKTNQASYNGTPGGASFTVDIVITGGGTIAGSNIGIIIGDGGTSAGGSNTSPPAPIFLTATMTTGVFAGNTNGNNPTLGKWDAPPQAYIDAGSNVAGLANFAGTTTASGSVNAGAGDAVLATLTVSCPVGSSGDWDLTLVSDDTTVTGTGSSAVDSWTGGVIHCVAVPEPATALLLIGALPFLRRRRTA